MVAAVADGRQLEIELEVERETKHTIRFHELDANDDPAVGTLYVQKKWLHTIGDPTRLTVLISGR